MRQLFQSFALTTAGALRGLGFSVEPSEDGLAYRAVSGAIAAEFAFDPRESIIGMSVVEAREGAGEVEETLALFVETGRGLEEAAPEFRRALGIDPPLPVVNRWSEEPQDSDEPAGDQGQSEETPAAETDDAGRSAGALAS